MEIKGVLHVHSTHSYDGKVALSELKTFLLEKGIQFACMTEHTDELDKESATRFVEECRELSDENFIFVPGFEVPYKNSHILHIGTTEFVCDFANSAQLKLWRKVAPFVVLAHPVRNKFQVDKNMLEVLDGVEVWNQQYEGKAVARPASLKLFKKLKASRPELIATGGLDLHRLEHFGSPLTTIEAEELSEAAVVAALRTGYYTFGNDDYSLPAKGVMSLTLGQKIKSHLAILVIVLGKFVNKALASFGLRLPKTLVRRVRSKV